MMRPLEQLREVLTERSAGQRATAPIKRGASIGDRLLGDPTNYVFRRTASGAELVEGSARGSDFDLILGEAAVQLIYDTPGDDVGAFGVNFFRCMLAERAEDGVQVTLNSGLINLTRKGYLKVLLLGGPSVIRFMAQNGYIGPGAIAKAIKKLKKSR